MNLETNVISHYLIDTGSREEPIDCNNTDFNIGEEFNSKTANKPVWLNHTSGGSKNH